MLNTFKAIRKTQTFNIVNTYDSEFINCCTYVVKYVGLGY